MYITRLESNEIFSPSNKIHRELDRAKDLSAPRYAGFSREARRKETTWKTKAQVEAWNKKMREGSR
jgi:hypothetical protein